MVKLTRENFLKARDYIFSHSDDINRAWFRYNFEDENTDAFMYVLAKYQHENGGFGGLVYEYKYSGSSLHSTEHAFRYIFYLKERPSASHPVIKKAIKYLLDRYRPEIGCWGEVLESRVNDEAHVPWWTYGEDDFSPITDIDERINKYSPNCQTTLAAFIAQYIELVPEEMYKDIIFYPVEKVLRYFDEASPYYTAPKGKQFSDNILGSPYNLRNYQFFCDCLKDKSLSERLKNILSQNPTACMELNPKNWFKPGIYNEIPCHIVVTPNSFLYPIVKDLVDKSLDTLVQYQNADGSWKSTFYFGDGLEKIQTDMEAHFTMLYLAELKRFGRIENV